MISLRLFSIPKKLLTISFFTFLAITFFAHTSLAKNMEVADSPVFMLSDHNACAGDVISVPITVAQFDDITRLGFTMNWDESVLELLTISGINSAISSVITNMNASYLTIDWIDPTNEGVSLSNDEVLFVLNFDGLQSTAQMTMLEFTGNEQAIEISFNDNGNITPTDGIFNASSISVSHIQMGDDAALVYEKNGTADGYIDLDITGGIEPVTYAWDNGSTDTVLVDLSEGTYSCVVSDGNGCQLLTPNFEVGNITSPRFSIQDYYYCPNDTVSVDISIKDFKNMTSFQFSISFDDEVLEYISISDLHNSIPTMNEQAFADYISFSWYDPFTTGVSIDNYEDIFTLNFIVVGDFDDNTPMLIDETGLTIEVSVIYNTYYFIDPVIQSGSVSIHTPDVNDVDVIHSPVGESVGSINISVYEGADPFTFNWSNGEQTEDINNLSAGFYSCTITNANGCSATVGPIEVPTFVSTNEIESLESFQIFPNPTSDQWRIEASFYQKEEIQLNLYNVLGELVFSKKQSTFKVDEVIDASNLAEGNYFFEMSTVNGRLAKKLVVLKR